eukprot:12402481-Karenia_brevis.AAC.1
MSDGASRKRSGLASAAWALLAANGSSITMVAGGALLLAPRTGSLEAEGQALTLAVMAFQRLATDRALICPHDYSITANISELPGSITRFSRDRRV